MKITKKQIKAVDKGETNMRELFPEVFESKLEVGKWYKHKQLEYIFCFNGIYKNLSQYGLSTRGWSNQISSDKRHLNEFIQATEEEVKTALINEAKKRGFKNGVCISRPDTFINGGIKKIEKNNFALLSDIGLQLGGFAIMENGIWATVIETITKEEAEKQLNKKIV